MASEVLLEGSSKFLEILGVLKDVIVGIDNQHILGLYHLMDDIKPIVESLTLNYSNDYAISKQVQLLYKTSKEIEVFINSLISRHSWLERFYIGFNGIKKLTRLGKTDEEKINSFKTTINQIKNSIMFVLNTIDTNSSITLNTQMDELLETLKTNISSEDFKRIELLMLEKEKMFDIQLKYQNQQIEDCKKFIYEKDIAYMTLMKEKDESYKDEIEILREDILRLRETITDLKERLSEHSVLISRHDIDIEKLKNETKERMNIVMDMVEMTKYQNLFKEKLDIEDKYKSLQTEYDILTSKYETIQKDKLEQDDKYKSLEVEFNSTKMKCIQNKFDEEVFKNLERNYMTLSAKHTQLELEYKYKIDNYDAVAKESENRRNQVCNLEYKIKDYERTWYSPSSYNELKQKYDKLGTEFTKLQGIKAGYYAFNSDFKCRLDSVMGKVSYNLEHLVSLIPLGRQSYVLEPLRELITHYRQQCPTN